LPIVAAPPTRDDERAEPERVQSAPPAASWEAPSKRRWYGWQTLLVDVPSFALWIGGAASSPQSPALAVVGFTGFILDGPIVHAAHGHWGKAGASIAFRAGTVLLAGVGAVGCINDPVSSESGCRSGYATLLVVGSLGVLAAVAVDAAVIAREDVKPDEGDHVGVRVLIAEKGRGGGLVLGGAL
jgi:hypothetical protein